MKRMIPTLILTSVLLYGAPALSDSSQATSWKGQVEGDYVRKDEPFHLVAADQATWERTWRMRLDTQPPRALRENETGVLLIAGPRPTPGYAVHYKVANRSADQVTLEAWVADPDVVMFPAGSDSHPYRFVVLEGRALAVRVNWR